MRKSSAAVATALLEVSMSGDNPVRLGEGNWRGRERGAVDRQLDHRRRLGSGGTVFRQASREQAGVAHSPARGS